MRNNIKWLCVSAFVGSMCGDQLYYYIGRTKGPKFLEKRPHWKPKTDRAFKLLRRYQNLLILCFRFLYGIRIVTPFVIGASGIHPLRYIALNTIGAVIWAVSFAALGYTLGESFELLMAQIGCTRKKSETHNLMILLINM